MNRFGHDVAVLTRFVVISSLFSLLILSALFFSVPMAENAVGVAYLATIPLYYYFIILISVMLLLPLYYIPYLSYLVIIPKIIIDLFLIFDVIVFNVYRFHIDLMFINMVIHDLQGIGISLSVVFISIFIAIGVVLINGYIFWLAHKSIKIKAGKINVILFILLLVGQLFSAWAEEANQRSISQYTPYFPYYAPLKANMTIAKLRLSYPNLLPAAAAIDSSQQIFNQDKKASSLFNYPLKPITFKKDKPTTNILMIVLESWQARMLTKDIMPNMVKFSENNYSFTNHLSGGNATVPGLFSLFYGLHPSYLKYGQGAPFENQTVLTKSLKQQGYSIEAFVSTNLKRFSLKPMFFGDIDATSYHDERSAAPEVNDRKIVDQLIATLDEKKTQPWFKFVFLNSSHHGYRYPVEYTKFTPVPNNEEGFLFNKEIDSTPFINDYKNSLYYLDALFADINQAIKYNKLDENTIVIITGDHAEEFNENKAGYWGHGSNFTQYQTHVPLLMHVPGNNTAQKISTRSAHIDIVPTILTNLLHSDTDIGDYSSGEDLFALPEQRSIIQASYKDKGYIINDTVYSTGLDVSSYDLHDIKKKNTDYQYKSINKLRYTERKFLN